MIPYRFYRLDRSNHISGPPLEKDCLDDEEAIGEALRVVNGQDIEVWHAARLVARLDSRKKAALLDEAVSDLLEIRMRPGVRHEGRRSRSIGRK